MPSKRRTKNIFWIGGVVGFLLGVLGNLLAAWIQQDLLRNSFTPLRISFIILFTILGGIIIMNLDANKNLSHQKRVRQTIRTKISIQELINMVKI